jgi:hypothetical protein
LGPPLIGNILNRCITDAGYRGHNTPPDYKFKVYTSGGRVIWEKFPDKNFLHSCDIIW